MSGSETKELSAEILRLLLTHFEGPNDIIEHTFRQNEDFRSLCEDYYTCHQALKRWQVNEATEAAQRQDEYTEWRAELANEIRDWLQNSNASAFQSTEGKT